MKVTREVYEKAKSLTQNCFFVNRQKCSQCRYKGTCKENLIVQNFENERTENILFNNYLGGKK